MMSRVLACLYTTDAAFARFLDFVGENTARAAEQAREILYAKPGPTTPGEDQDGR
jgi:hypothetical protein